MTDNDIKKALECCITADSIADCMRLKCPMYTRYGCTYYLKTDDDNEHTICREQFKAALDLMGLPGGDLRLPLTKASPETKELLKKDLERKILKRKFKIHVLIVIQRILTTISQEEKSSVNIAV